MWEENGYIIVEIEGGIAMIDKHLLMKVNIIVS